MARPERILLLAGSAEARQIAVALKGQGIQVQAVMSEPPRGANPMPVPFEVIPDISVARVLDLLGEMDAIVDASHGFDGEMTRIGHQAGKAAGVPCLSLARPQWDLREHPLLQSAADIPAAMALIAPGARVFSATGWASLPEYADFPGAFLMLRQTSEHDRPVPFDFVEPVFGKPPFTVPQEGALFKDRKVDTLIARNLGGKPSRPKLDAALSLGLNVILIDRPAMPQGAHVVQSVSEVLEWVATL